jgi:hypothetical protein
MLHRHAALEKITYTILSPLFGERALAAFLKQHWLQGQRFSRATKNLYFAYRDNLCSSMSLRGDQLTAEMYFKISTLESPLYKVRSSNSGCHKYSVRHRYISRWLVKCRNSRKRSFRNVLGMRSGVPLMSGHRQALLGGFAFTLQFKTGDQPVFVLARFLGHKWTIGLRANLLRWECELEVNCGRSVR